ncbi:TIGR03905 family TSCPD domain-containing protein [Anaerophilus nitritogenes]|uniref:TIGR03905 family TSCPD domain-containing protein n=1 Tax=Anaerophilus nitritogenes TaxID=2498136 RepID=UPI00101C2531|nr:TIGR03905 family TSCPD domain-containing protein [Anaerophilus nitritogenes]
MYSYQTTGVCAKEIYFSVENNKIKEVQFLGGCSGNLQGISKLVQGMDVDEAINRLSGIPCGNKNTSCPDQFSKALLALKEQLV